MANATQAHDVVTKQQTLELRKTFDIEGKPVRVLCMAVNQVTLMSALGALPMAASPQADASIKDLPTHEQIETFGYPMIERTAFLMNPDGTPKRPSFTVEPVPGAIWLGSVDVEDVMLMLETSARLNGWLGGPAAELGFPADREGREPSAPAVDAGEGDGVPTFRLVASGR